MRVYLRAQTDSVWFEVEDFKIAPQILTRIVCLAQEPIRSWLVAYLGNVAAAKSMKCGLS
jgi:hypothetical protein